ncbi:hypothetical protein CHARACLAT_024986 [Characodon lateralis]|uniref:Prolactin receptor n=1 Tax=Characodon lateralis TaxID=208331 RepID=A0ABU7EM14_9TELE|nr:hypothetical protein [Characodon lateralis]
MIPEKENLKQWLPVEPVSPQAPQPDESLWPYENHVDPELTVETSNRQPDLSFISHGNKGKRRPEQNFDVHPQSPTDWPGEMESTQTTFSPPPPTLAPSRISGK